MCVCAREGSPESRQLAGLLARELLRQAREVFASHAAAIMPQAFLCKWDADKDTGPLWAEVWEEGATSQSGAMRLYMADLVQLTLEGEPCCVSGLLEGGALAARVWLMPPWPGCHCCSPSVDAQSLYLMMYWWFCTSPSRLWNSPDRTLISGRP